MLSPRDDDDDDSHLCIKCNSTIVGLDNYVKHRKERCGKKSEVKTELPTIGPLEPSYSLGADVFFQSLELQSSVKKTSLSRLTPPIPIAKSSGDRKSNLAVASTSRDIPRMSPLETNLRGEDWIGGHSLKIGSNLDNQTKLINAVASISGMAKKEISTSTYGMSYNDFKGDDDSEESEDSEDDDDEEIHLSAKWKPPPHHTGGKWRPVSPDHDDWALRDEPEHTGGKWKPIMPDTAERDDDYDVPPPHYTKGKWVPGAHDKTQIMQTTLQTKGSVQYWCGPCNRRLGSRAIYEKHLMSSLHMRKVLPEHELEFSGHLEPFKNVAEKRSARLSRFVDTNVLSPAQRKKKKPSTKKLIVKVAKKKRKRKPVFIQCFGCKSRVRAQLMGKHLISHYHFRKATETHSNEYQQLILNNIHAMVHQSPFQCSPCKFYTNWLSNFMQHWFSEEHERKINSIDGRYWCSFCKFECETSQQMLHHLSGMDHSEVVAVINRSMPIIIRKKTIITCETCLKEFRYNIELKKHCQRTGHQMSESGTDNYQELHKCHQCTAHFRSSVMLAAHLKSKHKQRAHMCMLCSMHFKSAEEAKKHRHSSEHRIRRKEKMVDKGQAKIDLRKKCPYCVDEVFLKNVLELKEHIQTIHPDIKKTCPKCGMTFLLSQEVSRHVRSNTCKAPTATISSAVWSCSQCFFTTNSQAECFFHEVLHTTSTKEVKTVGEKDKIVEKYACPLCPKVFRKWSLREHLRKHTFERPFICNVCGANFTRQSSLMNHSRFEHGDKERLIKQQTISETQTLEEYVCCHCKEKFYSRPSLLAHISSCKIEERRCPHPNCTFVATSVSLLSRHRTSHGVRIKHYECPHCKFKTDQSSHMKRHILCHTGKRPYYCPHCNFTCGSLENLRKHVLRSGRHLNCFLYFCNVCNYKTNMATELRVHLIGNHSDKYNAKTANEAVKNHLMHPRESKESISIHVDVDDKEDTNFSGFQNI